MKLYRVSKVEAELTVRLIKEELGRKVGGLRIIVVVLLILGNVLNKFPYNIPQLLDQGCPIPFRPVFPNVIETRSPELF